MATSLACLLDTPPSKIPQFEEMGKDEWRPALEDWLSSKELALTSHSYPPLGFAIAVGWRDDNVLHAVIVKDGDFYHDPNPSGQFVRNIRNYWTVSKVPGAADVA